jgi:tetratricopeptide (TPR) repeat protein
MFVRQGSLEEAAALWQAIGRENLSTAPAQRFAACWQADIPVWPLSLPATIAEEHQTFWHQFNATLQAAEFAIAQQQLTQFAQQLGNPPWLAEWQEVLFLFRAEHALRVGQALLDDPLIPTRPETIDLLRGELLRRELDHFTRQAERQPERLEWSWEVAVRLKQLGNFSAAIQSLEPLVSQPAWQGAACLELAECWQRLRQFEKALQYYRQCVMAEVVTAEIRNRGLNQGQRLAAHLGQEDWPG